jgi:VWA domain containing CoxE-like protein
MERLARLAHRIVWVNPRAGSEGFSVAAGGMVAAFPHVDALVSGHNFEALRGVAEAIRDARSEVSPSSRRRLPHSEGASEEESWASATPVAGSSVAMPSGYGPSRGKTTPGWATDDA